MAKVFISHSSEDKLLVHNFDEFLRLGMNFSRDDVFCSSQNGALPTGDEFIPAIRNVLTECDAVIFLITEAYLESPFCLAELGAAWALGREVFPFLVDPITHNDVERTPLLGRQCLRLFERSDLFQLGSDFLKKGFAEFDLPEFDKRINQFLEQNGTNIGWVDAKKLRQNQDAEKYIEHLKEQAINDDKARFLLGTAYLEGILVKQQFDRAAELIQCAASNGYAPAQHRLSKLYYKGQGVQQSFELSFEWLKRASEDENPEVLDSLGFMYRTGLGCTRNLEKALKCYLQAIEKGCRSSYSCVAEIYSIQANSAEAIKYYTKAVEKGYLYAAQSLGLLYKEGGQDFSPDYDKAAFNFEIAAQAGMTEAKYQMGQLYYMGYAVFERDFKAADKWFREAAEEGDARSQYNLGYAYHHGLGVQYDWDRAVYWYEQAAKRGHQLSQVDLADLYAQIDKQEYGKAIYWYSEAAKQGSSDAHRKLGDMYFFGLGYDPNQIAALNHYRMAIEQQDYIAQLRVAEKK